VPGKIEQRFRIFVGSVKRIALRKLRSGKEVQMKAVYMGRGFIDDHVI